MSDGTHIEWTDATWNPVTGCSVVSPGCTNCYAMKLAGGRLQHHPSRAGLTVDTRAGPVWNGQVRFNPQWLDQPIRWRRPRRIFVCAHGDLFHESVPDEWIDRVFAAMALAPQHTFQVLTKRAGRMRAWAENRLRLYRWYREAVGPVAQGDRSDAFANLIASHEGIADPAAFFRLPLFNVWLGVSTEDQQRADERIPYLLSTPAAVRFVSAEPLLGPITLAWAAVNRECDHGGGYMEPDTGAWVCRRCDERAELEGLDWVIVGGESGTGARAMHPAWARQLRDECASAGVAFFFKQWGSWHPSKEHAEDHARAEECTVHHDGRRSHAPGRTMQNLIDGWVAMCEIGKRAAGRHLDGRTWDDYPIAGAR